MWLIWLNFQLNEQTNQVMSLQYISWNIFFYRNQRFSSFLFTFLFIQKHKQLKYFKTAVIISFMIRISIGLQ